MQTEQSKAYLLNDELDCDIEAVILAKNPEEAALLAGGELAGIADAEGWLVAYKRDQFSPPSPEEYKDYIDDEEAGAVFWIFRKGPIEILLAYDEDVTYRRLMEIPLIS